MNLSPRQIRYVCEVARLGSIQAAASAVHISQSSIVAAIDIAEDALGAKIFDRRPARGVQITPTGERFVTAARGLLAANGAFEREIGVLAQGTPQVVRIGCFEPFGSLFIAEVLKVYADRYGPVEIELVEGDQRQLRDWLANGSVDLIITYEIGPSFEEDCMTKICKVPAHVILPAHDPLARNEVVSIAELSRQPMVLLDLPQTSTYLTTLFDLLAAERPPVALRTRSYETVRSAVSAGFGFSFVNMRPTGKSSRDGTGIVRRPLSDVYSSPALIVVDIYGSNKPMFVRSLIQVIRDYFKSIGPAKFAVTTPDRTDSLFDV